VIGYLKDNIIFQSGDHDTVGYEHRGTLERWQAGVAARAVGNPLLMFALSCGFAGPLLAKCHAESGGFHIRGASSEGKTTLLRSAVSIWGAKSHMRTWNATANGMEGIAVRYNDNLLALDEINECSPKDIGAIVYALANGVGKQRASRTGAARATVAWRLIILSSGERSLAMAMGDAGLTPNAGQDVRLLEVPVKRKFGGWDNLHGMTDGAAFSNALKSASDAHCGHAGRAFLERLTRDRRDLPAMFEAYKQSPEFKATSDDGQDKRATARFALVALAGELAAEYSVAPWDAGDPAKSAAEMFKAWQSERNHVGNREPAEIREQLADFIDKHGASRFARLRYTDERTINNRAGWYDEVQDESRVYYFTSGALREAIQGFDLHRALDALREANAWAPPSNGKYEAHVRKIPGHGTQRVFPIDAARLMRV
jgi:putative DNA primase/helicase